MAENSPKYFLITYSPLVGTIQGQEAIEAHDYPLFVDSSCRREPDFEAHYPSISCLCRRKLFAPRLHEGDKVMYITRKGFYFNLEEEHWRKVAILQVVKRFESHQLAADWYRAQGLKLPGNCMVEGNEPLPLDHTGKEVCNPSCQEENNELQEWDDIYHERADECGVFLACEVVYMELYKPPMITRQDFHAIFRRVPSTQAGKEISEEQFLKLAEIV